MHTCVQRVHLELSGCEPSDVKSALGYFFLHEVQKRKKLVEYQTKTRNWSETFRPLRGFFSLRLKKNRRIADWRSPSEGETSLTNFSSLSYMRFCMMKSKECFPEESANTAWNNLSQSEDNSYFVGYHTLRAMLIRSQVSQKPIGGDKGPFSHLTAHTVISHSGFLCRLIGSITARFLKFHKSRPYGQKQHSTCRCAFCKFHKVFFYLQTSTCTRLSDATKIAFSENVHESAKLHRLHVSVAFRDTLCPTCGNKMPTCSATGRPLTDDIVWICGTCHHAACQEVIDECEACPLCYAQTGYSIWKLTHELLGVIPLYLLLFSTEWSVFRTYQ